MQPIQPIRDAPWRDTCEQIVLSHLQLPPINKMPDLLSYDLAIIGGGIAGLSAAEEAADHGLSVVVLEGHKALASGASGRNAGIFCAGINMPITYTPKGSEAERLWHETHEMLLAVLAQAAKDSSMLDVRRIGAMCLATSSTAGKRLARETKARQAAGMSAELIGSADVDRLACGFLEVKPVLSAMLLPDEGAIHPFTLVATIANAARRKGAQIYGDARVEKVTHRPEGWQVKTASGNTINCQAVISAVGPIENPTGRIFALAFEVDMPETCPVWWDANPYIYYDYRPGNGCLTVSGGRYGLPGNATLDDSYHRKMAEATRKWAPGLTGEPKYCWAVDLHVASDLLPEIVEKGENHLSIQGLGALGVLPGMVLGRKAGKQVFARLNCRAIR